MYCFMAKNHDHFNYFVQVDADDEFNAWHEAKHRFPNAVNITRIDEKEFHDMSQFHFRVLQNDGRITEWGCMARNSAEAHEKANAEFPDAQDIDRRAA